MSRYIAKYMNLEKSKQHTPSVPNYRSFDFFNPKWPSLTTRLIQKFMQNITSFVVDCFINTSSSRVI